MTIEQAIRELQAMSDNLDQALEEGADDIMRAGLDMARMASSGTLSLAEMRRQDHPYARRHRRAKQPAYIINRQSGQFYAGWKVRGWSLLNDSEHAKFLAGTPTMVARPVDEYIAREMERATQRMMEYRLRRVV